MKLKFAIIVSSLAMGLGATPALAVPMFGVLNSQTLFSFDSTAVGVNNQRAISGLTGTLASIDFRPATGQLYGLTSTGGLYTINTMTGAATLASQLSAALNGTSFDIAFNPTVDRLRIVSNTGQNLRVNVDTGAVTTDGAINRNGTVVAGVSAVAYTNQLAGATSTTLYDIDLSGAASLNTQSPPNDGTLMRVGSTANSLVSFDIDGTSNIGYVANDSSFGTIDLVTGIATVTGNFGVFGVTDITVAQNGVAAVPEPASWAMMIGGFGMVGGALRTRRRKTVVTYG